MESALGDLRLLSSRIQELGLFSPNETIEEVTTKDLVYMTVPFVLGELEVNARAMERDDRLRRLGVAQVCTQLFLLIHLLLSATLVPLQSFRLITRRI